MVANEKKIAATNFPETLVRKMELAGRKWPASYPGVRAETDKNLLLPAAQSKRLERKRG